MSTTDTAPTRTEPVHELLEQFVDRVVADVKGHQVAQVACLGDHLGLFDALVDGPRTSDQVAAATGLDERHVREWLFGMAAAGYVEHDLDEERFHLAPEQAAVLAADDSPVAMGGLFHQLAGQWAVLDHVLESFRTGRGIDLEAYPDAWWDGLARFTDAAFATRLLQSWVPAADGVQEALSAGARIADVGCGRGRALVRLLDAHPDATGVGYDLSHAQLAGAREYAAEAGVDDRVEFRRHDAAEGLDGPFDLVTGFDVAHDLGDVDGVFAAVHDALADDGTWLLLEMDVGERVADNTNPIGAILYGFSLVYCLPTSIATGGDALGTCGLPEREVRTRARRAGFRDVVDLEIEDPFNRLYHLRP